MMSRTPPSKGQTGKADGATQLMSNKKQAQQLNPLKAGGNDEENVAMRGVEETKVEIPV